MLQRRGSDTDGGVDAREGDMGRSLRREGGVPLTVEGERGGDVGSSARQFGEDVGDRESAAADRPGAARRVERRRGGEEGEDDRGSGTCV